MITGVHVQPGVAFAEAAGYVPVRYNFGMRRDLAEPIPDVVMPASNGIELAEQLVAVRPELKVLYMSGYAEQFGANGAPQANSSFLQKPFTADILARKVWEVLI